MQSQTQRIAIANDTLAILNKGYYIDNQGNRNDIHEDTTYAIAQSEWFKANEFESIFATRDANLLHAKRTETIFEVTPESTLQAAKRLTASNEKVFCLNFASAKNPGGGFLGGAQAQEETLARSSALYPCIEQMKAMYNANRNLKTCLYSDDMIYSPNTPVLKEDDGSLLSKYYKISFLTSPAINAGIVNEREKENIPQMSAIMTTRIEKILSIAVAKEYRTLLLGAWGCGVFRNNPTDVATYFKHQLIENPMFNNYFEKVVFAIYSPNRLNTNLQPFIDAFL